MLLATWYCTPRDLEDLATGWLIGEGFVDPGAAPVALQVADDRSSITVAGALNSGGSRPAGIRGLEALSPDAASALTADGNLRALFQDMFQQAELKQATGGVHSGALVVGGRIHSVREDVSRHCVIDKLIGCGRRTDIDPAQAMILLSGRVSATIAAKVARAGVPVVATISIPTTLAAAVAARAGVTIIGRARSAEPHIYSPEA